MPLPPNDSTVCHFIFRRAIMMGWTCSMDEGTRKLVQKFNGKTSWKAVA
jgi:hypothetical protein